MNKLSSSELRKIAQGRVRIKEEDLRNIQNLDIRQVLHELYVHQEELEMQNEELKRTHEELEESKQIFLELYEYAPVGYISFDETGKVLHANFTLASMFGSDRGSIVGKPFHSLMKTEDMDLFYLHLKDVFKSGERQICVLRLNRNDGAEFYAELNSMLYRRRDGSLECRSSVADITSRKEDEDELKNYRDQLEELVAARTEELNDAKKAAEEANRAKTEFLSVMSHEMRTPLQVITSITELLSVSMSGKEEMDRIAMLKRSVDNLMRLISDVLDLSKIEAGRVELEETEFDPGRFIDDAVGSWAPVAEKKGVQLISDIGDGLSSRLIGDSKRLRQILDNLIGNAFKFTNKGEVRVEVRSEMLDQNHCTLLFSVKDTGIGIPLDKQKTIFERFTQADSSTTRIYGGTGLGLSIVNSLVGMMGGNLRVESEEGKGSAFFFSMPCRIALEHPIAQRADHTSQEMLPLNILFMEDDLEIRSLTEQLLRGTPYKVDSAVNGQEGVLKFKGGKYNLVLMDLHMPVMDGYEAAREIRKFERENGLGLTPIVALTGSVVKDNIPNILNAGCNSFLMKPVKSETLLKTIRDFTTNQ